MTVERECERDIDLLLAEGFAVSPPFAAWVLGPTSLAGLHASGPDVHVSRADVTGGSDVVVVYETVGGDQRVASLIEDKVDVPIQHDRGKRYRLAYVGLLPTYASLKLAGLSNGSR